MVCDIDNKNGNNSVPVSRFHDRSLTMEAVCAALCFLAGAVFLLIAIFTAWYYILLTILCVDVGVMIYD